MERRRRGMVFNTAGAGGEDCLSSVVCLEKKTNSLCIVGSLTQRVKGLREERASSQRSHRVAQLKAVSCLGEWDEV